MKQVIFSLAAMLLVFFFGVSVLAISNDTTREKKLDTAVSEVAELSLEQFMDDPRGSDISSDDIRKFFEERLYERLSEAAELDVVIESCDLKRGLLSVSVRESFVHPNGKKGEVSAKKILLLEQEKMRDMIPVTFYMPDIISDTSSTYTQGYEKVYRRYELMEGESIVLPEKPPDVFVPIGKTGGIWYGFSGWRLVRADGGDSGYEEICKYKIGSSEIAYDGEDGGAVAFVADYREKYHGTFCDDGGSTLSGDARGGSR